MQKVKTLTTPLFVIMSSVAFAQADVDFGGGSPNPTPPASPAQQVDWLMIGLIALLVVIGIGCLGYIIYIICDAFKKHFKKIDELPKKTVEKFKESNYRLVPAGGGKEKSQSNSEINSAEDAITLSLISSKQTELKGEVEDSIRDISNKFTEISNKLDSGGVVLSLDNCNKSIKGFEDRISALLQVAPDVKAINEHLVQLVNENQAFISFSINSALELVKKCQTEGLTTPDEIARVNAIAKKCRELRFSSPAEIELSKQYYDARHSHEEAQKQLKGTIASLNANIDSLEKELVTSKQTMDFLCPDAVRLDSLSALLKDISPELKAETLVLVVQLYWFAQLSRNTPNKIKAAFTKFDETLFELFSENQELLQAIRQSIQPLVNNEIFKNTSYQISWPALNSSASEHEDHYNRENDEGNRICKVRSATIFNAGNIESVARIYTSL